MIHFVLREWLPSEPFASRLVPPDCRVAHPDTASAGSDQPAGQGEANQVVLALLGEGESADRARGELDRSGKAGEAVQLRRVQRKEDHLQEARRDVGRYREM